MILGAFQFLVLLVQYHTKPQHIFGHIFIKFLVSLPKGRTCVFPPVTGGFLGKTVRKLPDDAAGCCAYRVLPSSQGVSKMDNLANLGLWYNLHSSFFKV